MGTGVPNANVNALVIDGAGRILLAGPGANEFAYPVAALARVTSAGLLDSSFNGTGFNSFPGESNFSNALALDPSGRILLTGNGFTTRFAATGATDPTFNGVHLLHTAILAPTR